MAKLDGRRQRTVRTRAAIAEALLALIEDGDLSPSGPKVARRAGVSVRTVFHHFANLDAVQSEAIALQAKRIVGQLQPIPPALPFGDKLDAITLRRSRLYEQVAPVRRVAMLHEPTSKAVARALRDIRTLKRVEVAVLFAREIERRPVELRAELAAAAGTAASFATWQDLRWHQGASVERARGVMRRMLAALLGGDSKP